MMLGVFHSDMDKCVLQVVYGKAFTEHLNITETCTFVADNEPGVGPGPLKEFFEMCLTLFTTDPITTSAPSSSIPSTSNDSSVDLAKDSHDLVDLEENNEIDYEDCEENREARSKEEEASSYIYSSLFPLFQPAGEAYPECIVPRPLQLLGQFIHSFHQCSCYGE